MLISARLFNSPNSNSANFLTRPLCSAPIGDMVTNSPSINSMRSSSPKTPLSIICDSVPWRAENARNAHGWRGDGNLHGKSPFAPQLAPQGVQLLPARSIPRVQVRTIHRELRTMKVTSKEVALQKTQCTQRRAGQFFCVLCALCGESAKLAVTAWAQCDENLRKCVQWSALCAGLASPRKRRMHDGP
jgi:hypothetical protein